MGGSADLPKTEMQSCTGDFASLLGYLEHLDLSLRYPSACSSLIYECLGWPQRLVVNRPELALLAAVPTHFGGTGNPQIPSPSLKS